jgi:tetratricopeptide (TPR) repeat protein
MVQLSLNVFLPWLVLVMLAHAASGQTEYLHTGNQYLNEKRYDEAEQTFREAIKSDTSNLIYQCQLALALLSQSKYNDAQVTLNNVLSKDSANIGALWYAGLNNFNNKNADLRIAIGYFEKALTFLQEQQNQYYAANWYIGRSLHLLLQKDGITYDETSRLIEAYATYLRMQPNAKDADSIKEFLERVKRKRPPSNVMMWVYRTE